MKRLLPSLALLLGSVLAAQTAERAPIDTLRAVHDLPKSEASKALPVAFEGTVTFYHPVFRYLFVQEGDVAIFVLAPVGTPELTAGDRVVVKGVTHSEFRPDVFADSITVLRHGEIPKPLPVDFDQLMSGKLDCRLITIRGRVRAANLVVRPDVRSPITFTTRLAYLELLTEGGYIDVILNSNEEGPLKDLLDADIEVTGVQNGKYDGKWHQTGSMIRAWSFSNLKVLKRAAASPWSLPITPIDEVLTGLHVEDSTKRVRVNGTITYYQPGYFRPGSAVVIQNGTETLWVESLTDKPLRIGDLADATGIPAVVSGSPALTHAEVQDKGEYFPVAPLNVTWSQLADADMAGKHHYDLVTIEGVVVMEARGAAQDEYVLAHEGQLFSAIFHHPDSTSQLALPPMKEVPLGSKVRVTGVCIMQDTTLFSGRVPFNILLRSFDDVAVVAKPSSLNIRNLVRVVSLLLLAVVVVAVWGWTLRSKVRRQTAALTERIETEAALERRMAQLEQRRSRILEDINGSEPLAHILEEVCELVSFSLEGVPCWCEVTDGARLGHCPAEPEKMRVIHAAVPARSGPPLGSIFAGFWPASLPEGREIDALSIGSKLAALAIETRRLYADLVHRSEFDLLTDILNRFSLEKNLEAQIEEARKNARIFGLIYIDLDEFKQINDQFGHNIGDLYLQEVAARMKRQLRSADLLARLGGDEFAALVPVVRSRAEVEEIALRLEHSFNEPYAVEGYVLRGSASVGIALYPEDADTRDGLLSAADTAMYVTKHTKHETQSTLEGPALT
jgi:diguanylate cyclase (GGDEF)-like protein